MNWSKIGALVFLAKLFFSGSARAICDRFRYRFTAGCKECLRAFVRFQKMLWILAIKRGNDRTGRLIRLCLQANPDRSRLYENVHTAHTVALWDLQDQNYEKVIRLITPMLQDIPERARCYGVRGHAYFLLGLYREAYEDLNRCHALRPEVAFANFYNLTRSFLHSLYGKPEEAMHALGEQLIRGAVKPSGADIARMLSKRLERIIDPIRGEARVGVFIASSAAAVGHAVLDPFHFFNLFARDFDTLILIHPARHDFSPATQVALNILEQYFDRVECYDPEVMMCSWQNIGPVEHENTTYLLYHYWELNRLIFKARRDPHHPLYNGRKNFELPVRIANRAEAICRRQGISLDRPIVVVHVREQEYHGLRVQSFRNVDVQNYVPALRGLIARGYQVIRIGDAKMSCIQDQVPGLIELPRIDEYASILDPFFISRCEFMISCQSGPCSYARVFGKPTLVLNAVYHYTLIPEEQELIAFKDYRNRKTGMRMPVEQIFREGGHLLDRSEHFKQHNIDLVEMTPEEILAAVEEMLEWLRDKDRPEHSSQIRFRQLMEYSMMNPPTDNPMATRSTDYIGYALPECRISDAVVRLRPEFFEEEIEDRFTRDRQLARSA
jgi:putative glycosyltransferase (TIGR04372 family)